MAIKTFLSSNEITAMKDSAGNLRDLAILTLLSDSGIRVSELLGITPGDIDLERGEISIQHLKRGAKKICPKCSRTAGHSTKFCARCGTDLSKIIPSGLEHRTRTISIGEETSNILADLLTRSEIPKDKRIFDLTRQMVYYIVRDAALAAGLEGRVMFNPDSGKHHFVHPHDFRTALAVSWLEYAGGDASKQKALQTHLGHSSFDTTSRYNKLTPGRVKSVGDAVREQRFGRTQNTQNTFRGGAT